MKTGNQPKIPPMIFLLNTIEFFAGLFALCCQAFLIGTIIFFLLALNLILGQIWLLHAVSLSNAEEDDSAHSPAIPPDIDRQILELTRSNAALTESNRTLTEQLALCEEKLLSAPSLYHCPLTSATPVNINKTLRSYYEQHAADFSRYGLQCSLHMDTGNCETLLSKSAFTLICDNLLDNSLKYTPNGGIVVITLSKQEDDALLIWKNSGNGIPENDVTKVFDLNFHINQSGSGTGLGLAQTKAIINDYGGSIWVKSSLESGFTVYIQIPSKQKGATE